LITVDELRAAGALDVPPAWRKSLGGNGQKQGTLFSDLSEDDDPDPNPREPDDRDGNGSAEELS
jgi:hypothetical protein